MTTQQNSDVEALNVKELAPFLSVILAMRNGCTPLELSKLIKRQLDHTFVAKPDSIQDMRTPDALVKGAEVIAFNFELSKAPSWLDKNFSHPEIRNIEHHCVIIYCLDDFCAIYCSLADLRDVIRKEILSSDQEQTPTPVPISKLFSCFIDDDNITMLWLSHIGGKSRFKPGSKSIGGDGLADSLDPMDDQTYSMSAVRTKFNHDEEGVKGIGLNPYKSMVWSSTTKSWENFSYRVMEILDDLNKCDQDQETEAPISILSYPINSLSDVKEPYEFAIADSEVFAQDDDSRAARLVRLIESEYSYELDVSDFSGAIRIRVFFNGASCGEVEISYSIKDYRVKLKRSLLTEHRNNKELKKFCQIFGYEELIKIWFESAHTMLNGMVFKTELKDLPFEGFLWADFGERAQTLRSIQSAIYREKPTRINSNGKPVYDPKGIGHSNSLFCWIKNNWNSLWNDNESFFSSVNEKPKGWLYCDDGSGEKADFIHIGEFDGRKVVTFIHAKAAKKGARGEVNNNRGISVGAHDIVVNQAVKNLRHCDRKNLANAIEEQIKNSQVRKVWLDGELIEGGDEGMHAFKKEVRSLPISHDKRVVVIQPHTRRGVYENQSTTRAKLQLDTILLSARRACASHGAEFYVVGTED